MYPNSSLFKEKNILENSKHTFITHFYFDHGMHPDLKEHQEIAALLIQFIKDKKLLGTLEEEGQFYRKKM